MSSIVYDDTCTETSDTNYVSHTPDSGNAPILHVDGTAGVSVAQVIGADDWLKIGTSTASSKLAYRIADIARDNVTVEFEVPIEYGDSTHTGAGEANPAHIYFWKDDDNWYQFKIWDKSTIDAIETHKCVADVQTNLNSNDIEANGLLAGNKYRVAFESGNLKIYRQTKATEVSDTFTEASDTNLASHTPDTGTGWASRINTTTSGIIEVVGSTDNVRCSVTESSVGALYTATDTLSAADCSVAATITTTYTGGTNADKLWLIGRYTDTNNFYGVGIGGAANGSKTIGVWKKVGGTISQVGSDATGQTVNNGDGLEFVIRGHRLWVLKQGTAVLAVEDTSLSSAGQTGIGFGNVLGAGTDAVNNTWRVDNFVAKADDPTSFTQIATVADSALTGFTRILLGYGNTINTTPDTTTDGVSNAWLLDNFKVYSDDANVVTELVHPPHNSYVPTIYDGNGNKYMVGLDATNQNQVEVWKATSGGDLWQEQDAANHPINNSNNVNCLALAHDTTNKCIHMIYCQTGASVQYRYARYNLSDAASNADTWRITDETVGAAVTVASSGPAVSGTCRIEYRGGAGNPIVATIQGDEDSNKGTKYQRVDYTTRAFAEGSTTWSTHTQVEGTTSTQQHFVHNDMIQGASGKVYIVYGDNTNGDLCSISLTSADSLGTVRDLETTADAELYLAMHGCYYDAAGTERITIPYRDSTTTADSISTVIINADGAPDTEDKATATAVKLLNTNTSVGCMTVDSTNDKAILSYVDNATSDIWRDENTNDGGWGTDTEDVDAVTALSLFNNFYNNTLALVYQAGTELVYAEFAAASTQNITHSNLSITISFGSHTVKPEQFITHSSYSQTINYGSHTVTPTYNITHSNLSQGINYGSHTLTPTYNITHSNLSQTINYGNHTIIIEQFITPSNLSQTINYGSHTLTTAYAITHSNVSQAITYGSHTLTPTYNITHSNLSQTINYGSHTVVGLQTITHSNYSQSITYGSHTLIQEQFITHSNLSQAINYGSHTVGAGLFITHSNLSQAINYGSHTLTTAYSITHSNLSQAINYGSHTVIPEQFITHSNYSQGLAYGSHTVTPTYNITHSNLSQGINYGSHTVTPTYSITHSNLAQGINYGSHTLTATYDITHSSFSQTMNYGSHTLTTAYDIAPSSYSQTISYGSHTMVTDQFITHSNLTVVVDFGTHRITGGELWFDDSGPTTLSWSIGSGNTAIWSDDISPTGPTWGDET